MRFHASFTDWDFTRRLGFLAVLHDHAEPRSVAYRRTLTSAEGGPACIAGVGRPTFARLSLWESNALAKEVHVVLLVILALIVALFIGLGFVVKWLFILALIAALIWVIAFFMRGARA